MTDPEEVEPNQEFEQKVRSAFQIRDPDQLFIDRLQKELADRYKADKPSTESVDTHSGRSPWTDKFKRTLSPLAWGAIAVILIISLVWGIKTLIPRVEVGGSIPTPTSPIVSPSPALVPTQAEGAEGVINLPVPAGMPVPWPEEAITSMNVSQVTQLARWGRETISTIAWAPDGNSFAVASSTKIHIYDCVTFQEINTIDNGSNVYQIAYSPDGTKLASAFNESSIKIWDVASGSELRILTGHKKFITRLAFSPDGEILASGAYEESMKLWAVGSGQELRTLSGARVINFAFSPDGTLLATTGGEDKLVRLWDIASGEELRQLSGHTDYVYGLEFSPDGTMVASTSNDMTIKLWDVTTGNELQTIEAQTTGVAFLPEGHTLVFIDNGKPTTLWDIDRGQVLRTIGEATPEGSNLLLSPDGKIILFYLWQGNEVMLFDIASGEELRKLDWQSYVVTSIAVSPDARIIATGLESGPIQLLDAANGQELRTLTGHTAGASSLAFSPDGMLLASGSGDQTTRIWDVASGAELYSMKGVSGGWVGGAPSVDFSPDGKLLAFAGASGQVKVWDVNNHVELRALGGRANDPSADEVMGVAFSPDGKILASGYAGGSITLWDALSGQELRTLTKQSYSSNAWNRAISGLEFTPDGKMLVSGNWDMTITWWDVASWSELRTLPLSWSNGISSLVFSPNGDLLAIGGGFEAIILLDAGSGEQLVTLARAANGLAFSPDGKLLISGSYDGPIRLWGMAPPNAIQQEAITTLPGEEISPTQELSPTAIPKAYEGEKIPIPILFSGENLQPISYSPDENYLLYSQQGAMGEPGENQATISLGFLDNRTGETCQGIQETVAFTQTEWGAYPIGVELYERTAWIDDQRLLYLNRNGELGAITRCDDAVENWGDAIPDKLLSLRGSSNEEDWQIVVKGEQAFWLFTPATGQAVKLNVPIPPEGQDTMISWSPWDEQLISSRIDSRPDGLWIVLERIDTATGAASPIYEIKASPDLYNIEPKSASFDWVRKDQILLDYVGTGMGLLDLSSQPSSLTDLFADVFGIEGLSRWDLAGWGTMPHTDVQEYLHVMLDTGLASDGQFYLYHPESGQVDQYPLNPPFLIVYPGGEGGIVQPFMEAVVPNDVYKVIFVDSDVEPYDLVVEGHLPRPFTSLTANVLPGAEQVLFNSEHGISLVDLTSGETMKFWEFENQEQYQNFYTWVSQDGKTALCFASAKTPPGEGSQTQVVYWLRLEP